VRKIVVVWQKEKDRSKEEQGNVRIKERTLK
jgi:hypothetical protein